jgi:ATP-dependent Clp protease protease subunit
MRSDLNKILSKHSGKTVKKVQADTERDNFMSAEEAKKYGLIDKVLDHRPEPEEEKDS